MPFFPLASLLLETSRKSRYRKHSAQMDSNPQTLRLIPPLTISTLSHTRDIPFLLILDTKARYFTQGGRALEAHLCIESDYEKTQIMGFFATRIKARICRHRRPRLVLGLS